MTEALLEIIKLCEDFQNMDTEGMELEKECDAGYTTICKIQVIVCGMLDELKARQACGKQFVKGN